MMDFHGLSLRTATSSERVNMFINRREGKRLSFNVHFKMIPIV